MDIRNQITYTRRRDRPDEKIFKGDSNAKISYKKIKFVCTLGDNNTVPELGATGSCRLVIDGEVKHVVAEERLSC